MTRRSLFKALAGVLPVGATGRLEADVRASDLVTIEFPGHVSAETSARIRDHIRQMWERATAKPGPPVIILDNGAKLSVHRGVARVVTDEANIRIDGKVVAKNLVTALRVHGKA